MEIADRGEPATTINRQLGDDLFDIDTQHDNDGTPDFSQGASIYDRCFATKKIADYLPMAKPEAVNQSKIRDRPVL